MSGDVNWPALHQDVWSSCQLFRDQIREEQSLTKELALLWDDYHREARHERCLLGWLRLVHSGNWKKDDPAFETVDESHFVKSTTFALKPFGKFAKFLRRNPVYLVVCATLCTSTGKLESMFDLERERVQLADTIASSLFGHWRDPCERRLFRETFRQQLSGELRAGTTRGQQLNNATDFFMDCGSPRPIRTRVIALLVKQHSVQLAALTFQPVMRALLHANQIAQNPVLGADNEAAAMTLCREAGPFVDSLLSLTHHWPWQVLLLLGDLFAFSKQHWPDTYTTDCSLLVRGVLYRDGVLACLQQPDLHGVNAGASMSDPERHNMALVAQLLEQIIDGQPFHPAHQLHTCNEFVLAQQPALRDALAQVVRLAEAAVVVHTRDETAVDSAGTAARLEQVSICVSGDELLNIHGILFRHKDSLKKWLEIVHGPHLPSATSTSTQSSAQGSTDESLGELLQFSELGHKMTDKERDKCRRSFLLINIQDFHLPNHHLMLPLLSRFEQGKSFDDKCSSSAGCLRQLAALLPQLPADLVLGLPVVDLQAFLTHAQRQLQLVVDRLGVLPKSWARGVMDDMEWDSMARLLAIVTRMLHAIDSQELRPKESLSSWLAQLHSTFQAGFAKLSQDCRVGFPLRLRRLRHALCGSRAVLDKLRKHNLFLDGLAFAPHILRMADRLVLHGQLQLPATVHSRRSIAAAEDVASLGPRKKTHMLDCSSIEGFVRQYQEYQQSFQESPVVSAQVLHAFLRLVHKSLSLLPLSSSPLVSSVPPAKPSSRASPERMAGRSSGRTSTRTSRQASPSMSPASSPRSNNNSREDVTPLLHTSEVRERAMDVIEQHICTQLYGAMFAPHGSQEWFSDTVLSWKLDYLRATQPRDLGVSMDADPCLWQTAVSELQQLHLYRSPDEKMNCLMRCVKTVSKILQSEVGWMSGVSVVDADTALSALVYAIIRARPQSLGANLYYISLYLMPEKMTDMRGGGGQLGYCLTQFNLARSFIDQLDNLPQEKLSHRTNLQSNREQPNNAIPPQTANRLPFLFRVLNEDTSKQELFLNFCRTRQPPCDQHLLFLLQVHRFKAMQDVCDKASYARQMYAKYIGEQRRYQVAVISDEQRETILLALQVAEEALAARDRCQGATPPVPARPASMLAKIRSKTFRKTKGAGNSAKRDTTLGVVALDNVFDDLLEAISSRLLQLAQFRPF